MMDQGCKRQSITPTSGKVVNTNLREMNITNITQNDTSNSLHYLYKILFVNKKTDCQLNLQDFKIKNLNVHRISGVRSKILRFNV